MEKIKKNMTKVLGIDFGSMLFALYNEIIWLTFQWIEFKELFGTKESRIELMNEVAPFFFFAIQKVLRENLMLGISKITDPVKSCGKRNTTINAIPMFIKDNNFKNELEKDIKEILDYSSFCRDWRNRWIAHLDYELATHKQNAKPLELTTRQKLKFTIEKLQDFYHKIESKYFNSRTGFEFLSSHNEVIFLLHAIENGQYFSKMKHEKKISGEWENESYISKV